MLAADGIALVDVRPGIFLELLDAQGHLALVAVKGEDDSFHFVTYLKEILSGAEML